MYGEVFTRLLNTRSSPPIFDLVNPWYKWRCTRLQNPRFYLIFQSLRETRPIHSAYHMGDNTEENREIRKGTKKKNTKKGSGQWFQFLFILVLFVKSDILKKKIKNWSLPSDSDRIGPWIDEEEERRRIYINIFSLSFVLNVGLIALDHAINLVKFVVSVILPVGLYDEKGGHYSLAMHLVNTKKEIMYFVFSSQFFFFFIFLSS